jgi:hypothetical protein
MINIEGKNTRPQCVNNSNTKQKIKRTASTMLHFEDLTLHYSYMLKKCQDVALQSFSIFLQNALLGLRCEYKQLWSFITTSVTKAAQCRVVLPCPHRKGVSKTENSKK